MRADRLVSIMMLLQSRGRLTAQELADTLEVSIRTIYRDIEALSTAGIPIYAERGSAGGYSFIENYRTELTGLTEGEARALFLLSTPSPLDSLEVGQKLKTALRKLQAALPDYPLQQYTQPRIHLDWTGWEQCQGFIGHVDVLYTSVQQQQLVQVSYRLINGVEIQLVVKPLGMVAKAGVWYLVFEANSKIRPLRIADLLSVEPRLERFDYPKDFNLQGFWEKVCAQTEERATQFRTLIRASAYALVLLSGCRRGPDVHTDAPADENGWTTLELYFETFEAARQQLLGMGRAVEVLEPEPLRLSILDYAQQIVQLYQRTIPQPLS